jgi:2-keto-4-pentenoate hydratase/2-oxohepta-3-ene-1,7-dioic acid hydratase in catechol pathway
MASYRSRTQSLSDSQLTARLLVSLYHSLSRTTTDCKDVSHEDALGCVLGYTIANDVSARGWQSKNGTNRTTGHGGTWDTCVGNGGQWSFSKVLDNSSPNIDQLL